jgi:hypothetical protein
VKKRVLAIGFLAIATSAAMSAATSGASAQAYGYWGVPYGYGPGIYNYGGPYAPTPYAAPHAFFYGYDPYGSAYNWDYYRVDQPGRGNNVESTR